MALQIRRGDYGDFDKSRMLPGEPAAVLANDPETPSGKAFYVCYEAGDVKRLISIEDLEEMVTRGEFKGEKGDKGDTGKDGTSVTGADINDSGHLILTMSDRTQIDAGLIDDALAKIEEATRAATSASESASAAEQSEKSAGQHNTDAEKWAKTAQSYATGDSGSREGEGQDNAKEYARQAKASADRAAEAAGGDFVTHAEVGETVAPLDESRKVPKENIPADVGKVQGVKGEAEEAFRDGNVIIKKSDIGLGNVEDKNAETILGEMDKQNVVEALGYEPVGGQGVNLLLNSNVTKTGKSISVYWEMTEEGIIDQTYTFSALVDIPSNVKRIRLFRNKGAGAVAPNIDFTPGDKKEIKLTFVNIENSYGFLIYPSLQADLGTDDSERIDLTVYQAKLERGTVTNPIWTPSPEDLLLKGEVDGRNLFIIKDSVPGYLSDKDDGTVTPQSSNGKEKTSDYIPVSIGEIFTIQTWATAPSNAPVDYAYMIDYMWFSDKESVNHIGNRKRLHGGQPNNFYNSAFTTEPAPDNAKYMRVDARLYSDGKIKVEKGSIATDWTPAPEDIVTTATKLYSKYDTTLETTGWQNDATPYTYEISVPGLSATQLVIVTSGGKLSKEQLEAYAEAVVDKYDQQAGKVILQALNKPSVNLPIALLIGGDVA